MLTGPAAVDRLYGLERLEGYTNAGEYYSRDCYFVYESIFFRRKDLDAVVVDTFRSVDLCLNPFSSRFEKFRRGPFVEAIQNCISLVDPIQAGADGKAFFADCDYDRRDTNSVICYVRQKYDLGRPTINKFTLVNIRA